MGGAHKYNRAPVGQDAQNAHVTMWVSFGRRNLDCNRQHCKLPFAAGTEIIK